jgi:hypothetical protein
MSKVLEEVNEIKHDYTMIEKAQELNFTPPLFGVTILGCSHGFDHKGSTSGYIIWINKK